MSSPSALILHNLFGRFPELRVLSVENGSLYVPYLLKVMDKMKGTGRNGPWLGGYVEGPGRTGQLRRRSPGLSQAAVNQIMSENMRRVIAGGF